MSEKEGILSGPPSNPASAPPSYGQATGYPPQGYGSAPGVPSYSMPQQQGYPPQQYGYGQQNVIVGQPRGYGYGMANPAPDHMGLAILSTVLCCWPIGIFAIVKAQDARRALDRGDMASAFMYSQQARRMALIAIVCGSLLFVVVIGVVAVLIG